MIICDDEIRAHPACRFQGCGAILESYDITPFRFRDLLDQPADGGTTIDDKDG
jgi:hypothetical protein